MPLVRCPECGRSQTVRRELAGLIVACEKCASEFRATVAAPRTSKSTRAEPFDIKGFLRGAGVLFGILLGVGLIFGVIILIIRAVKDDPVTPATAPSDKAPAVAPLQPHPSPPVSRPAVDLESHRPPDLNDARRQFTVMAAGVRGLTILVGVIAYLLLVLLTGAWVAKDASARGMPGLGWACFYYSFHLIARFLVCPFAVMPNLLIPGLGVFVLFLIEPIGWIGLVVYLLARRRGRCSRCPHCGNQRMTSLVTCPICGAPGGV